LHLYLIAVPIPSPNPVSAIMVLALSFVQLKLVEHLLAKYISTLGGLAYFEGLDSGKSWCPSS